MKRKIVKVGNSLGVIIPSAFLEEMGISHQDEVHMELNKELKTITITTEKTAPNDNYLEQVVRSAVDDYLREKGI